MRRRRSLQVMGAGAWGLGGRKGIQGRGQRVRVLDKGGRHRGCSEEKAAGEVGGWCWGRGRPGRDARRRVKGWWLATRQDDAEPVVRRGMQ